MRRAVGALFVLFTIAANACLQSRAHAQEAPETPVEAPEAPAQTPPAPAPEPAPAAPAPEQAPAPSAPSAEDPPAAPSPAQPPAPAAPPAPALPDAADAPLLEPGTQTPASGEEPAQGEAPSAAEPEPDRALSEVLVTASKREERAQDVPTPITTAGTKDVLNKNLVNSADVERLTPNLSGQVSGNRSARIRWFMRGQGSNDPSVNLESPVGVYQDEVYLAYGPLQSFPLFDVERVEVLKGPQGTLWGKNTTGGAIHFVSKRPSFTPSGYARATVGSYGTLGMDGGFGAPVWGNWLAARAAFYYEKLDGWAKNEFDGSKQPQYNDFASRLSLLANITNDLEVLLIGRFRTLNGGSAPTYPVGAGPGGQITPYPGAEEPFTPSYGRKPDSRSPFYEGPQSNFMQNEAAQATITHYIGDYTLTSISAVDNASSTSATSTYPPTPSFDYAATDGKIDNFQATQELRITSPKEDRLSWIAGFHYFYWDLDSRATSATFGPVAARKSYINNIFHQKNMAYAGFASARLRIFEGLALNGGVRYTYDKKRVKAVRQSARGEDLVFEDYNTWYHSGSLGSPVNSVIKRGSRGWSQVTFDVTPEYKITDDALVFFKFAKGFRAGTYNPVVLPPAGDLPARLPVSDPEILYDFELGAKTAWFDRRLIANVAGFYYLIDDVQLNVQQPNPQGIPGANTSSIQNAAGGKIFGLEIELETQPVDALRLRAGLGLLKHEYTDFITYQGTETVDASGNKFYRTPSVSASLGADYRVPIGEEQALSFGTDWTIRDRIYHNAVVQDDKMQETPPYALGNVELRYSFAKERLTLQAYVRNVTDTNYKVLSRVQNAGAWPTSLGPPRTWGLQLIGKL